jgi:hypothetical protein
MDFPEQISLASEIRIQRDDRSRVGPKVRAEG